MSQTDNFWNIMNKGKLKRKKLYKGVTYTLSFVCPLSRIYYIWSRPYDGKMIEKNCYCITQ